MLVQVQARGEQEVPQAQAGPRPPLAVQAERQPVPVPVAGQVRASSPPLAQPGRLSVRPTPLAQLARSAAGPQAASALGLTPVWGAVPAWAVVSPLVVALAWAVA